MCGHLAGLREGGHVNTVNITIPPGQSLACGLLGADADEGQWLREANQIIVRAGKRNKDRVTMLPALVKGPLATSLHIEDVVVLCTSTTWSEGSERSICLRLGNENTSIRRARGGGSGCFLRHG
jgi:hypothetical protein